MGSASAVANAIGELDLSGYASTVDVTYSRMMLRVTGTDAAKTMEKVCNLDFSDSMTPDGACAGASVAKVGCDVIRNDVEGVRSYRILCDRSFGQYLYDALIDSAAEFNG
jgi:heterotetrameric sarcosine oxidase gamma subunit